MIRIALALLLLFSVALAQDRYRFPPQLLARVLDPPSVARVNGTTVLAYELQLTNLDAADVEVREIEVVGLARQHPATLRIPGLRPQPLPGGRLPAGATALVNLWVTPETVPAELSHRIHLEDATVDLAPVAVDTRPPTVIGLPFRRPGNWAAIGGPTNTSGHRGAALVVDGRLWISQRFAVDWVILDEEGRMYRGDEKDNANHYCYGAEAIAVADGTVVDVYDGLPENVPSPDQRAVPITLETVGGNWVGLQIAPDRYCMYAHLQPGSIRVQKGQKVKKGEVLGLVGNTGNSTAPHLHFHVSTTPQWIASVGVPYVFERYHSLGYAREGPDDRAILELRPETERERARDLPAEDEVLLLR